MSDFDLLHPAVQHHIVNSLGWRQLRPLQEQCIRPVLDAQHVLLLAPTAGGKTEAALFPLLSRMLAEDWRGLGILYVCPLRALLNNLEIRLSRYLDLVGRRVALWHGDVGPSARRRIAKEPPDLLLTTPESLEVMLVSAKTDAAHLFRGVKAVVVDELHAFAGDDRGWHLLAVLQRISKIVGGEIQRLGLSATIGNPDELLAWLASGCQGPRVVVAPPADSPAPPEIELDYVGNLDNAARVVSRLHRGEKRLVFCDSRSGVEELAARLRGEGVETFVSHGSLGVEERRRSERAFAESRNCVIVATSTLELGLDVGDLDRVIQIDAPPTVAAFLQRMGRTGRRPGSRRNCLFLATREEGLLRAAALLHLFGQGYVEPILPPPAPLHIFAQQILALALQEGAIGRHTWRDWLGAMPGFAGLPERDIEATLDHLVASGWLFEETGLLSLGPQTERAYGYRHFMELTSVFTGEPLFQVRHGRTELGLVEPATFQLQRDEPTTLLLGGRSWRVTHVDWSRKLAYVEPSTEKGRAAWLGRGPPLRFELCQAIRDVLRGSEPRVRFTRRAVDELAALRDQFSWLDGEHTFVVRDPEGRLRWWTFVGRRANAFLAEALEPLTSGPHTVDNLALGLASDTDADRLREALDRLGTPDFAAAASDEAIDGLKFAECLPPALAVATLAARIGDLDAVRHCVERRIRSLDATVA